MIEINEWISQNKNAEILKIYGYCDSVDINNYNKKLARRRINSVIEILKTHSIAFHENLKINAIGEDFNQAKLQSQNRKVTVSFVEKSQNKVESPLVTPIEKKTERAILSPEDKVERERFSLINQFERAKEGDRIAIYNINFELNTEKIIPLSEPLLEELLFVMEKYPTMVIKIYGHICCNSNRSEIKLSSRRALKILNYLKDNGIQIYRLSYTGVGSNNPIYPIPEKNEEERVLNRRVEIEILQK